MEILGISAYYHDSAAAILRDGEIVAAAQEERFTRVKHDASFPHKAVEYCLKEAGITLNQVEAIAFYDKPFLKFERLLETYYGFAPRGIGQFVKAMPLWVKEKLFLKKMLRDELSRVAAFDHRRIPILFPEHHLSHAASAFYPSPFEEAAILTLDGVGEWATASISLGKGNQITLKKEMRFPHSLGLLYSAFTYYLGFKVNSGEYKLMGLAPYGNRASMDYAKFLKCIESELAHLQVDGSLWLNQRYFNYATGLRMTQEAKWMQLFGLARREPETELKQIHCDMALAIQDFTEKVVLAMAAHARELTGAKHLCLAGGVALNCVANGKLQRSGLFQEIFIQPAAGDAGGALGAALAAHHLHKGDARKISWPDGMKGAYLGPAFSNDEIAALARGRKAVFVQMEEEALINRAAQLLADGKVVGWFQGRMEFGPRALGNRSILGDARNAEMQKVLNLKIKFRESFRPFAPAVKSEAVSEWFEQESSSPYMLLVADVKAAHRKGLPENYRSLPMRQKLYFERSSVPAITHINGSARIQTVHESTNPKFHALLSSFEAITGTPMLVNTSFNVRGEPIVCTPEDAWRCFMRTGMDVLVMGNCLFLKEQQPEWQDPVDWKAEYGLD